MEREQRERIAETGDQIEKIAKKLQESELGVEELGILIRALDINKATLELIHLRINR